MDDFGPRQRPAPPDHYGCLGGVLGSIFGMSVLVVFLWYLDDAGGPLGFLFVLFAAGVVGLFVGSIIGLRIQRRKR